MSIKNVLIIFALVALSSCQASEEDITLFFECKPEILVNCNVIEPVCGVHTLDTEDIFEVKTYKNGCEACKHVSGFTLGACPENLTEKNNNVNLELFVNTKPLKQHREVPIFGLISCTAEQKAAQFCTMQYEPTCGIVSLNSRLTTQDFSNVCLACQSANVVSYVKGACPTHNEDDYPEEDYNNTKKAQSLNPELSVNTKPLKQHREVPIFGLVSCTAEQKAAQFCTMQYEPTCGIVSLNSRLTTQDFSNVCQACQSANVVSYIKGACPTHNEDDYPEEDYNNTKKEQKRESLNIELNALFKSLKQEQHREIPISGLISCPKQSGEICIQIMEPTCGIVLVNSRLTTQDFTSVCQACSTANVISYVKSACPVHNEDDYPEEDYENKTKKPAHNENNEITHYEIPVGTVVNCEPKQRNADCSSFMAKSNDVCGLQVISQKVQPQDFKSVCLACANVNVIGYVNRECPKHDHKDCNDDKE